MAGYAGTALAKKLGLKPAMALYTIDAPGEYREWLGELPAGLTLRTRAPQRVAAAHLFATRAAHLRARLRELREALEPAGFVWVSWPKKAAKVATDVTEDTIRAIALPMGFVDVKVCAVSDVWSGLKLVIRKSER
jgi:hypothetical protein